MNQLLYSAAGVGDAEPFHIVHSITRDDVLMASHGNSNIVVLLTGAFGGIGGIETFNRALIGSLDQLAPRHNWTVQVLSLLDCEILPGVDSYVRSPNVKVRGFSGNRVQFVFSAIRAGWDADIAIIGHTNLAPLALLMNSSFKCSIAHGIEVWKKLPLLKSCGVSRMNRILSVSEYTRRQMMAHSDLAEDRFCIFPNTLDPLAPSRRTKLLDRSVLGLPHGHMLLSVARLASSENYKNIRPVLESLSVVLAHVPDTFYVIVGDGAQRKTFEQLARDMGLADRVFLPGAVSDELLPSYYENCDLFVLPSTKEGFGIVFLEAMYHGKACIGARAGGIPEVIRDGDTGMLVNPSNLATQVPEAILQLLKDPALRNRLGSNGRARLEASFSLHRFRERLEEILCSPDHRVTMSDHAREA
jgi:glycosyltransferase involved in cell wall biosynthesis